MAIAKLDRSKKSSTKHFLCIGRTCPEHRLRNSKFRITRFETDLSYAERLVREDSDNGSASTVEYV